MVFVKSPTILTSTFEDAIRNRMTKIRADKKDDPEVQYSAEMVLDMLRQLQTRCLRFIPESEADPFRIAPDLKIKSHTVTVQPQSQFEYTVTYLE